ncbi:MAG: MFS transporter [Pseudomonadota bacterium]
MSTPTALRAEVQSALFYSAMFGALGAHLPFWPVWLEDWGLTAGEVGLYTSLGVAIRVVAGLLFPVLADQTGQRRLWMAGLGFAGAAVFFAHLALGTKSGLLVATIVSGAILSGLLPLGEGLGSGAARHYGFPYARPRALGSVAFLISSIVVGALIARTGADAALYWITACLVVTGVLALNHPGGGLPQRAAPPGFREIGALLVEPTFALFTVAAAMVLSSHAVLYVYGSVHWRSLGLDEGLIGALWAFSVGVEVVAMLLFGPALIRRVGPVGALMISGVGGVLRWSIMVFDPPTSWLWGLQAMHTLTFVCGHLGAVAFISAAVPERYGASAQGAFMGLGGGVLTALAMALAAWLYPSLGGGTYAIAAVMSGVGLVLSVGLGRAWHGRELAV